NCRYLRSVRLKFFSVEKSQATIPGPVSTLRPTLPNVPRGCRAKAWMLNHAFGVGLASLGLMPVALGRSLPTAVLDRSKPDWMFSGNPVETVTIELSPQPPMMLLALPRLRY